VPVDYIQARWQQFVRVIHRMADHGPGAIQILSLSQEFDWAGRAPEFLFTHSQPGNWIAWDDTDWRGFCLQPCEVLPGKMAVSSVVYKREQFQCFARQPGGGIHELRGF
jgi:hypothetical protein